MQNPTTVISSTAAQSQVQDDRLGECHSQSALYNLLGRILEEELDYEMLRLLKGDLRLPLEAMGVELGAEFNSVSESVLLDQLAEEFTGLLVAPGCISPYLSVFETGALFREPCDRVHSAYQQAGWDYQRHHSGEFPDHIGTMLGFVGVLYGMEGKALETGDNLTADDLSVQRSTFTTELLGPWAPGWCRRASEAAFHPFYQQMLALTEQLLWSELATLVDRRKFRELSDLNRREPSKLDYNADFRKASGI